VRRYQIVAIDARIVDVSAPYKYCKYCLADDALHRWPLCQVRRYQFVAIDAMIVDGDAPYKYSI
jgi:hypothetical protein